MLIQQKNHVTCEPLWPEAHWDYEHTRAASNYSLYKTTQENGHLNNGQKENSYLRDSTL